MIITLSRGQNFLIPLIDAKAHLRVDADFDDALIYHGISEVQKQAEDYTGRAIAINTYQYSLDELQCEHDSNLNRYNIEKDRVVIRKGFITELVSIKTFDTDGVATTETLTDYTILNYDQWSAIIRKNGADFPTGARTFSPIEIEFKAGFTQETLPFDLKQGMLQLLGQWYENRDGVQDGSIKEMPFGVTQIFKRYRLESI